MILDAPALRKLAATRLYPVPPAIAGRGDQDLNPDTALERNPGGATIPAAVLVPIVARPGGLTLLLTERTADLASHPGQVAFPGGKIDPGDSGPQAAALREAEEEIGLPSTYIEPLGYLDTYQTGSGFRISPLVALVTGGFTLVLNSSEVAAAFEVPLTFLLDPANHQVGSRDWRGKQRHFYVMSYHEHYVWGVTAGMIRNLYDRLLGP